mmetsp:Transcript_4912/g.8388  ORF Transcript_4912/g.8388 Transcript_4912/m.8388 type:complete len:111 (+) Transcript_4912:593-925(+)
MFSNIIAMHDHSFLFVYPLLLESYLNMHQNLHGKLIASATIQTQKSKRNGVALTYSFRRGSTRCFETRCSKAHEAIPVAFGLLVLVAPIYFAPSSRGWNGMIVDTIATTL